MIICKQVASPFLGKKPFNLFIKMGQSRPLFVYFRPFHITISIIQIEKSLDGVIGIQTWCHKMVGADKTIELWRPPFICTYYSVFFDSQSFGTITFVLKGVGLFSKQEDPHHKGKYHSVACLQFDWFGLTCFTTNNYFLVFLKNGPSPAYFQFIFVFSCTNFTTNISEKCPSSIQCWDSTPRPSEHEYPPITTRPQLSILYFLV